MAKANGKKPAPAKSSAKTITRVEDLRPDPQNANRHTERGTGMMEASLREVGFADSLTVDSDGVVLSGNQRLETLASIGMSDPIIVQSDGTRPIIHQRTDLKATDPRAQKLALFANRVGELNLDWDPDVLAALREELNLDNVFSAAELDAILGIATPPADFKAVGSDLETEYCCPKCGYEWSGQADPGHVRLKAAEAAKA